MTAIVDICNRAISYVGGTRIVSLDDNTAESKACKIHYSPSLRKLLTQRYWTFCKARVLLSQSVEEPISQYRYKFKLPSDCLVVRNASPKDGDEYRDWEVEEDRFIYADEAELYIEYTREVTDPNQFPPAFTSVLEYLLASRICNSITASRTLQNDLYALYQNELSEASPIDGRQGAPQTVGRRSSRLINSRWRGWQR